MLTGDSRAIEARWQEWGCPVWIPWNLFLLNPSLGLRTWSSILSEEWIGWQYIFICDVFTFLWYCCSVCSGEIFELAQHQWKSCVKNSKAASLTFTLTIVTAWNGKFFDPCWKKAREGVKGGCFIMSGGHFCYSTLWMTVIKLKSWRDIEICCDLVLIILNSLEMRLGDFCH